MIFIYSYSQCRIMLATKLPRPRHWRFITFANLMFILILPLLSLSRQLPYSSWKNHKTDITGDTQTGPCRRQFILFWIGIGVFIFVEKGKQQEEKREEKKPAIVTEVTNVHSTLMLLPLPPFSRLYHLVRCAKHFRLMICNSCSVISYLGFSWVFPRKNGSLRSFRV